MNSLFIVFLLPSTSRYSAAKPPETDHPTGSRAFVRSLSRLPESPLQLVLVAVRDFEASSELL